MRSISHGQQSESPRLSAFVYFEMIYPFLLSLLTPFSPTAYKFCSIHTLSWRIGIVIVSSARITKWACGVFTLFRSFLLFFFLKYLLLLSFCMHNYYFAAVSALSFIISERAGAGRRGEREGKRASSSEFCLKIFILPGHLLSDEQTNCFYFFNLPSYTSSSFSPLLLPLCTCFALLQFFSSFLCIFCELQKYFCKHFVGVANNFINAR